MATKTKKTDKALKVLRYVVYRQEGLRIDPIVLVTASVTPAIIDDEDLVKTISNGVTKWVRATKEGRELYEYAGTDMNLGDLAGHESDILPYCIGVKKLSFDWLDAAPHWVYDTSLCDDISEDVD